MYRVAKITIALVVLVLLGAVALWGKPTHPISWSDREIQMEAVAGETTAVEVFFKAGSNLGNVELRLAPELAKLGVSASPATLIDVAAGKTYIVTLTSTPPADAEPEMAEGTLHVGFQGHARTLSKPLPITLNVVWPNVVSEEGGFAIHYPGTFEEQIGEVGVLPSGEHTQILSFESEAGDFTLDWQNGYPSSTSITEWADGNNWPTADGDWREIYVLTTLNANEVLQDPDTGSVIMAVGDRLYYIFNGIGLEPTHVDLGTFQAILESLDFAR